MHTVCPTHKKRSLINDRANIQESHRKSTPEILQKHKFQLNRIPKQNHPSVINSEICSFMLEMVQNLQRKWKKKVELKKETVLRGTRITLTEAWGRWTSSGDLQLSCGSDMNINQLNYESLWIICTHSGLIGLFEPFLSSLQTVLMYYFNYRIWMRTTGCDPTLYEFIFKL